MSRVVAPVLPVVRGPVGIREYRLRFVRNIPWPLSRAITAFESRMDFTEKIVSFRIFSIGKGLFDRFREIFVKRPLGL